MGKDYTSICPPAPSEVLALVGLRARAALVARSLAIVEDSCHAVVSFIAEHNGTLFDHECPFQEPSGGTLCFPRLVPHFQADDYAESLAQAAGVMVLPGNAFEGHSGRFDKRIRIGLGR